MLRGGRRRVVRPSRGRLRDDVAGHAARDGRAGGADRGRRGGASLAAGLVRRRGVRGPRARERPAHGAPRGRGSCPARGGAGRRLRGCRGATRPCRRLATHRCRARRWPAGRGGAVRVRLRTVAADAVPRRRGRSHRGHQAGRRVRRTTRGRHPLRGRLAPLLDRLRRLVLRRPRGRRPGLQDRAGPLRRAVRSIARTTGSSTPTRSASLAATWRAASRTSPTGRSWRPAPASTRRPRTRTSSSTAIRRSTTCGSSGVGPATASSTGRRSAAT